MTYVLLEISIKINSKGTILKIMTTEKRLPKNYSGFKIQTILICDTI